jgi:hypothetical protein
MQAVVETHSFRRAANEAGLTEDERLAITNTVAANPMLGDLMEGTGGARKLRLAARGKGKSGGYRIITFYAAADVPEWRSSAKAKIASLGTRVKA